MSLPPKVPETPSQSKLVLFCSWASNLCEGASRIIIPVYFSSIGFSALEIAASFFSFEVSGLFANIVSGIFANRYGYKRAFVFALLASTLASCAYLLIDPSWSRQILFFIVVSARAFRGVGEELLKTTCTSYIRQGHKKKRGSGIQTLLGGKESIKGIGTMLGGSLLAYTSLKGSFGVLALTTFVSAVLAMFFLPDFRERRRASFRGFFRVSSSLRQLALARAFLYGARDVWIVVALPLYAIDLGMESTELAAAMAVGLIVFGLSQAGIGAYLSSKLRKTLLKQSPLPRFRRFRPLLLWPLPLIACLSFSFTMSEQNPAILLAFVFIFNFFVGVATIPHNHLHVKFSRKKRASMDISYYKTVSQLGKGSGVLLSGLIYESHGFSGCLYASSIFMICSFLFGLKLQKPRQEKLRKS